MYTPKTNYSKLIKKLFYGASFALCSWLILACPLRALAEDFNSEAALATSVLQSWYNGSTYNTTSWWNAAEGLEATIDYMSASGSRAYINDLSSTYNANHSGNFINNYYDDEAWWALTWIKAYDLTGTTAYLDQAKTIFADLTTGWDSTCGGGLWWDKYHTIKAAIENSLFLTVAARLHNRTPGDTAYLQWANMEWNWFKNSGMINSSNLVNNGLTSSCVNDGGETHTYLMGTLIGGLTELYTATGDATLLNQATATADAVIASTTLTVNGILTEIDPNGRIVDRSEYKGIYMRNLKLLYDKTGKAAYQTYMLNNAHSVWANDRNSSNQLGLLWAGPFDTADASRHTSALGVLNTQVTGVPSAAKYEAETLPETNSSGITYTTYTDAKASGGSWAKLFSNATGQYVEYTITNVTVGITYDVIVGVYTGPTRGQMQMTINGNTHGPVYDQYAANASFTSVDLGTFLSGSTGAHTFRFTVTGKNPSATGYTLAFDYITLTPQ